MAINKVDMLAAVALLAYIGLSTLITFTSLWLLQTFWPKKIARIGDEFKPSFNLYRDPFLAMLTYAVFMTPIAPIAILIMAIRSRE